MDSMALSIPFTTLAIDPVTYAVPTKRVKKDKREEAGFLFGSLCTY
jgi:hypothetical protein